MSALFEVLRRWPEAFTSPLAPTGQWVHDAAAHGVASWVAESLSAGGQAVPQPLVEAARSQLSTGRKHRTFTLKVLDALAARGVVPILLKGLGLATRFYPQPLTRPSVDVDLLVEPHGLATSAQTLEALGLKEVANDGLGDAMDDHHHRGFGGPAGLVELHHRLILAFGRSEFDSEAVCRRAVTSTLEGRPVRYLEAEDELLYLCVHAANHSFLRVSWLVDLKQYLARTPTLKWDVLGVRARGVELARPVGAALALAERLVGAAVPEQAWGALGVSRSWRAKVDRFVFDEARVASARWANEQVPAFLLSLYLSQTPGQVARHVFAGAQRALRRARSRA